MGEEAHLSAALGRALVLEHELHTVCVSIHTVCGHVPSQCAYRVRAVYPDSVRTVCSASVHTVCVSVRARAGGSESESESESE
eukprot:2939304-Rhodomonas_salina.1